MRTLPIGLSLLGFLPAIATGAVPETGPRVVVIETPEGGVQPQAVVDPSGTVHLVYLKGDPSASDVRYSAWGARESGFGTPVRVNDEPGTAVAMGTVRGAQIAIGRGGRVHVAWNGSRRAGKSPGSTPVLYARSDPARAGFEPSRNLMTKTDALDGGATIAADDRGTVIVGWHGRAAGDPPGEAGRRVWVARSEDDGATFSPEESAWDRPTGACACCGTRALFDPSGSVRLLYRVASGGGAERGMMLLTSRDRGRHFEGVALDPWPINACPMSTASLAPSGKGALGAWETRGQVRFGRVDEPGERFGPAGDGGNRKHPSIAANGEGLTLLAWTEGTGWQRGGSLAWQVFGRTGRPAGEPGRVERGIPTWGLPAAVARPDGSFAIIH